MLKEIEPSSIDELRYRIENRCENSAEENEERMERAIKEMEEVKYYYYVLLNDDIEECTKQVKGIINHNVVL